MSQNDFTIANQGFPAFRADLNSALQALASNNSGATEPSTMFANMWWYDSANNIMYIRNEDNDAWIKFAELDQTNDKFVLSGTLQLDDGTVSAPALTFNSDTNMGIYRGGTDILKFVTAGTDAITIASNQSTTLAGNLNVSKVNANTVLDGTTGYSLLKIKADSTLRIDFGTSADDDAGRIQYDAPTNNFRFYTDNTRVVDIDSSGNLLVGTTDTLPSNDTSGSGIALRSDGILAVAGSNTTPLRANRTGNDGDIIKFTQAGLPVGSIGAFVGDAYFGTGDTGILAYDNGNAILPYNTTTGAYADNSLDLGVSTQRFKDLYLSGGVVLDDNPTAVGGSVTSKTLDDYEEGTFVPVLSATTTAGSYTGTTTGIYTKVGNLVQIELQIAFTTFSVTPNGNWRLSNLPFVPATNGNAKFHLTFYNVDIDTTNHHVWHAYPTSASNIQFLFYRDNSTWVLGSTGNFQIGDGDIIAVSGTYLST